jgi:hypothetical protein
MTNLTKATFCLFEYLIASFPTFSEVQTITIARFDEFTRV